MGSEGLLPTFLSRLGVKPEVRQYYGLQRALLEDKDAAIEFLLEEFLDLYYKPARYIENDEKAAHYQAKADELYNALKDGDVVESTRVCLAEGEHVYSVGPNGEWEGNFCQFVLCRRNEPGRRTVGCIAYEPYNP